MARIHNTAALFTLTLLAVSPCSSAVNKVIYGEDDRIEYYEVPENLKAAADATVSLWNAENLKLDIPSGTYDLKTENFGDKYKLCPGVKFREQPVGAFCSGTLVGEDLVLTAGHCITDESRCGATAFVFGYAVKAPGEKARTRIDAGEVYACSKIIKRQWQDATLTTNGKAMTIYGPDFALIQLDRKVTGRKPMSVNRQGGIKKGDSIVATGHPNGLPFKFSSDGSVVKEVEKKSAYFVSNLDVFGGNSGGAVFNLETGLIEGIVVRTADEHFLPSFDGCNIYTIRPQNAGFGIHINKLDPVLSEIPLTPDETAAAAGMQADLESLRKEEFATPKIVNFDY
jgi:V8-like Glu-specific endopeptidase